MAKDKNQQIAESVLAAVGGKENVSNVLHCMTRLRFNLKDDGLADLERIQSVKGVLGAQWSGGQLQVIIGQNVGKVHAAVVALGVESGGEVDENLDGDLGKKEPLSAKSVGNAILGYLSGSMVPMIPVLMTAGLFKTISTIVAPGMLGLVAADSNLVVLLNFLYNAAFYFMPIYLGYNAAKQIGVTPMLGAYMGGILIAPAFVQLAADGASFDVFGIPCTPGNYSSTVLPILLSVWIMSYIEKFLKKHMPDTLSTIFTPFITMLVMTPVSLCALAPLGGAAGSLLGTALYGLGANGGILAIIAAFAIGALWTPMIATGMHLTIAMIAAANFMSVGMDNFVFVATGMSVWASFGCEFGAFLRMKDKDEKAEAFGYFISNFVGGVGEPFIYGMIFRHKRLWVTKGLATGIGSALAIALGVCMYNMTASNFLAILAYVGGDASNVIRAAIACGVSVIAGVLLTYFFGFTKDEIEGSSKQVA